MRDWRLGCVSLVTIVSFSIGGMAFAAAHDTAQSAALDSGQQFGQPDQFGGYATGHIIVRFARGIVPATDLTGNMTVDGGPIDDICRAFGAQGFERVFGGAFSDPQLAETLGLTRTWRVLTAAGTDTLTFAALLSGATGVEFAEIDGIGGIADVFPNDPLFSQQWGLHNTGQTGGAPDADIDAPEAWSLHTGGSDIIVAVIDTGVQATHPDLAGRVLPGWNTYDSPPTNNSNDPHGHGTHVAGILGANANNNTNICGVNWGAKILPIRCLSAGGSGTESQCAAAIQWAADNGARVISLSLQYYTGGTALSDAVIYAHERGCLLIAAAGNNRGQMIAFPARFPNCMCVGGTAEDDTRYLQGNYGPEMDLSAPGRQILSLWIGSSTGTMSGTSMSTPHVSGVAAMLMSYNRTLSIADIANLLKSTTDDLGDPGWDQYFGTGRLNAHAALAAATLYGDLNCDGYLNNFDIDPFVLALSDGVAYQSEFPACDLLRADMNGDGMVNNFDIDGFVAALAGG